VTIWLDNHLSPALARWIETTVGMPCRAIRDLGLARASDRDVFEAARAGRVQAILTKDRDFAELGARLGPAPGIILLTTGNATTANLIRVLSPHLGAALAMIERGDPVVEIGFG
jgi:predicted nuclease of predicted toxin-antitoxin system